MTMMLLINVSYDAHYALAELIVVKDSEREELQMLAALLQGPAVQQLEQEIQHLQQSQVQ